MAYLALAECVSFEADSMADLAAKKVESGGDRKRINNLPIGQVTVKMVLLIDIKPSSAAAE